MANNYRKQALKPATDTEMAQVLTELVETGKISAETVNNQIDSMREKVEERAKAASAVDEKQLSPEQQEELLKMVKTRFETNMHRHKRMEWAKVQAKLEASPEKMWSLNEMERTGGQPDVVGYDKKTDEYIFYDCSKESPEGRRNICYDRAGQEEAERRGSNPKGNAVDMAAAMGIEILIPDQYRKKLQQLGKFDQNTWSWVKTPLDKREVGVALVGFRRSDEVDVSVRDPDFCDGAGAFRGSLRV